MRKGKKLEELAMHSDLKLRTNKTSKWPEDGPGTEERIQASFINYYSVPENQSALLDRLDVY